MTGQMDDKPADDQKSEWQAFYNDTILPFWREHAQQLTIQRPKQVKLNYYLLQPENAKAIVLISPGRIEAAIKYPELAWELCQQGYAVAVLDHRGQGFSQRLTPNPHQGHVHHFSDFVDDFAAFVRDVEKQTQSAQGQALNQYLLAHSMGGAIAALYLARYPHQVKAAVLCSPMFGIQTSFIPHSVAVGITTLGATLNQWLMPNKPWYFIGMSDYVEVPFSENQLSHSQARYSSFREQYKLHPEVQLGGPTFRWLSQALKAARQAINEAADIHIPVLVVQGGADEVVEGKAQREFVCALSHPYSQLMVVEGGRHELLIESDEYRQPVINRLLRWFAQGGEPRTMDPCE